MQIVTEERKSLFAKLHVYSLLFSHTLLIAGGTLLDSGAVDDEDYYGYNIGFPFNFNELLHHIQPQFEWINGIRFHL